MKQTRHDKIKKLIESEAIENQATLKAKLEEDGIIVTQATLSRDINELGLVKTHKEGRSIYIIPERQPLRFPMLFKDSIINVDRAENIVVFKCQAGMAQAVCITLDRLYISDIVGTIAGDDTIFILMRTQKSAIRFMQEIQEFTKGEKL